MPTIEAPTERRNWILALVCLAQFMVVLDISIVNVALPSIRTELGFDTASLQWVVNAYTIAFAGLLLLGGRAADLFGQRRLFTIGLALFGVSSLVAAVATTGPVLIGARALQGVGGAVLSPATLTVLITTFTEGRERAKAMGLWSALAGAGGAAGSLMGGALTQLLDWRWIFVINIPIAAVAIVGAQKLLKARNVRHAKALDLPGALLVTAGLVSFVYGIVSIEQHGFGSVHVLGGLALGVALVAWFLLHEHRVAAEPLMPLSIWRSGHLAAANVIMVLMACGMFAMWYLVSLDLPDVRRYSAMDTGLAFLPQTVAIIVGAQISSRLVGRIGARPLVVFSCLLAAVGLYWCSTFGAGGSFASTYLVPGVMMTFGMGLAITPIVGAATAGVAPSLSGLASGLINTARQVGGSIGLAALATVAARHAASAAQSEPLRLANHEGYAEGLMWAAGLLVLSGIAALWLPGSLRRPTAPVPQGASALAEA